MPMNIWYSSCSLASLLECERHLREASGDQLELRPLVHAQRRRLALAVQAAIRAWTAKGARSATLGGHGWPLPQALLGYSCTQTARALLPGGWPASGGTVAARAAASEGTLTLLPDRPRGLA